MAELREIPVEFVLPPDNPMRQTSQGVSMEELIEDIAQRGLIQPIGVTDLGNGWFKVRWGMRRTLAHRAMGKRTIMAFVHQTDEGDEVDDMARENFQREQLTDAEEAEFFATYVQEKQISVAEAARRLRVNPMRLHRALAIFGGDPEVAQAFREGRINAAQAGELCQITSKIHVQNLLNAAIHRQLPAKSLRIWWEQIRDQGVDVAVEQVEQIIRDNPGINYATMQQCSFCQQWYEYANAHVYAICHEDYDVLTSFYPHYQASKQQQQEGINSDTERMATVPQSTHASGDHPGGTPTDDEWLG